MGASGAKTKYFLCFPILNTRRSQPGNEFQKFWRNSERIGGEGRPDSRTRRKGERRTKIASKTPSLILELMHGLALDTPTQICEVQTTSAPPNCLPSAWGTRILLHPSSGVVELSVAYLAQDMLSGYYGQSEVLR
jgi:hypothetical protein